MGEVTELATKRGRVRTIGLILGVVAAAILVVLWLSAFSVGEWQQALVLQFGKHIRTVTEPGLHYKVPFTQNVVYLDKRLLEYDAAPKELITRDKQQLVVDNFSRWRIVDPLKFYQSVRNEAGAQSRLDDIIYSNLRETLGRHTFRDVLSGDRELLMRELTEVCDKKAAAYGIQIVDVRIKRTDLPEKNEQNVYNRMRTERERQAKKFRAEGGEEARKIRALADKEARIIEAEAKKSADIINGEGDAKALSIFAKAYNQDPDFFSFTRTLEAYGKAMQEPVTLILPAESEFFRYLKEPK